MANSNARNAFITDLSVKTAKMITGACSVALPMRAASPRATRIVTRSAAQPPRASPENAWLSRRRVVQRLVVLTGTVSSFALLSQKPAFADETDADLVTEAEVEIPEIESKLSEVAEEERKAVEAELDYVEKEVSEAEEKVAKGEESPEEAAADAFGFQSQLDAVRSALGF